MSSLAHRSIHPHLPYFSWTNVMRVWPLACALVGHIPKSLKTISLSPRPFLPRCSEHSILVDETHDMRTTLIRFSVFVFIWFHVCACVSFLYLFRSFCFLSIQSMAIYLIDSANLTQWTDTIVIERKTEAKQVSASVEVSMKEMETVYKSHYLHI